MAFMECRRRYWAHILAAAIYAAAAGLVLLPAYADKASNSVRFAYEQTLANVDPFYNTSPLGAIVGEAVWDALVYREPETGALSGNLATAWRWIDDLTLEFDLRQGVRFHNGEEFDADDVVYTMNFVVKPENKVIAPNRVSWIDHAERVDKYRVRVITRQPFAAALTYLALPRFPIHPNQYYAEVGPKGMNERPVGTGPFRAVEHALGKHLLLERNPDYFRGGPKAQPRLDRVEIRFIPDAQTRVAEAVASGLDLIMNVASDQADQLRSMTTVKILEGDTLRIALLQMNTMPTTPAPQLRDVRVRQAIMHAIDRNDLTRYLVGTRSRPIDAQCHPRVFGCTERGVRRYHFDPSRARSLLAEAGYPNGFDIDIFASRDRNQVEAIMGYLEAVGIRAHLRYMQEAALASALHAGRTGLSYTTFGAVPDPRSSLSYFHNFTPDDINRDPEVRALIMKGDAAMDPAERGGIYAAALALLAERAYTAPLYTIPNNYVVAAGLEFTPPPDEVLRFYEMSWR